MKQLLVPILALAFTSLAASFPLAADGQQKMLIALSTGNIELAETDVSSLAVGESKTIETESGSVIDILRTSDGAEIYIDGELLEIDANHEDGQEIHKIVKHVEVTCDDADNCEKDVIVVSGDGDDFTELLTGEGDNVIFHKEIRLSCEDTDGTSCSEENVRIIEDGNVDIEEIHSLHAEQDTHKIIVIKKEVSKED